MVIAIISILAGLLLPALEEAMESANAVSCSSQFRQILIGAETYANDYDTRYPNLNAGGTPYYGGYLNLGFARPHSRNYWNEAEYGVGEGAFTEDFCNAYLAADWGDTLLRNTPNPRKAYVPDLLVCPGLDRTSEDYVQMLPPGGDANATWAIGEHVTYGGFFVGYGSFLGHYKTPANGQGNTWYMPRTLIRRPSDEPLLLDVHLYRRVNGSVYNPARMTVPHGSVGNPRGMNEGFADGSVRWYPIDECNRIYMGAYPWDRKVMTPFYLPAESDLLTAGYGAKIWSGSSSNWPLFPGGWYGLNAYLGSWPP